MTLAGTRPPTVDEWDKYELHHRARLATKPGLTGMWQVSGRSNITDFRKLFCLVFFTVMILFRTLLNRNMWMNPLSDVMGGWWIWEKRSDGTVTLTTECFENIALMLEIHE